MLLLPNRTLTRINLFCNLLISLHMQASHIYLKPDLYKACLLCYSEIYPASLKLFDLTERFFHIWSTVYYCTYNVTYVLLYNPFCTPIAFAYGCTHGQLGAVELILSWDFRSIDQWKSALMTVSKQSSKLRFTIIVSADIRQHSSWSPSSENVSFKRSVAGVMTAPHLLTCRAIFSKQRSLRQRRPTTVLRLLAPANRTLYKCCIAKLTGFYIAFAAHSPIIVYPMTDSCHE